MEEAIRKCIIEKCTKHDVGTVEVYRKKVDQQKMHEKHKKKDNIISMRLIKSNILRNPHLRIN